MLEPSYLPVSKETAEKIYTALTENKLLTNSDRSKNFWIEQLTDEFTDLRLHPAKSLKFFYANRRFYVESKQPNNDGDNIKKANKALFSIYRDHLRDNDYL